MAINALAADGHRDGPVRKRSQLKTNIMGEEHLRNPKHTRQFIDQKADDKTSKGVRKECRHSAELGHHDPRPSVLRSAGLIPAHPGHPRQRTIVF